MNAAILSDIHANITALNAVLDDVERKGGVDEVWCLGDIVDYGPDPGECIDLIKKKCHFCVAGNHDYAAIGRISTRFFNPDAAAANRWTARRLTAQDINFLENLPLKIERDDFTLVHGSPRDPVWEYILSPIEAEENLAYFSTRYCLIGHSHIPLLFECDLHCTLTELTPRSALTGRPGRSSPPVNVIKLGDKRLIINPGGLGQPRDYDPRAAYAIYNSAAGTLTLYRVEYDIRSVQDRMKKAGLPERLVRRLEYGW